jgi:hypothetical protein
MTGVVKSPHFPGGATASGHNSTSKLSQGPAEGLASSRTTPQVIAGSKEAGQRCQVLWRALVLEQLSATADSCRRSPTRIEERFSLHEGIIAPDDESEVGDADDVAMRADDDAVGSQ